LKEIHRSAGTDSASFNRHYAECPSIDGFPRDRRSPPLGLVDHSWKREMARLTNGVIKAGRPLPPSLTTPAYFKLFLTLFERTSSSAHELRLSVLVPFICFTQNLLCPVPFINSVLPTNHLFGHDQP
jgi:hypothetical protein